MLPFFLIFTIITIGLIIPSAFAEHSVNVTVENAHGSSTPGCEPDCFLPSTVIIALGGQVTFANNDTSPHTSTSGDPNGNNIGAIWDSSLVMAGQSYTTGPLDAGEYPYFCIVHPWMTGKVIVSGSHVESPTQNTNVDQVVGTLQTEYSFYEVSSQQGKIVKIFGKIDDSTRGGKVIVSITLPDGTRYGNAVFLTETGYYELFHNLSNNAQIGTYDVMASYNGKIIGNISFDVKLKNNETTENVSKSKPVLSFVDQSKDPSYYVKRYVTEPQYKEWFDANFPDYAIWEGIGITKQQYEVILEEKINSKSGTFEDPDYITYSNSDVNFSIEYPKNWKPKTNNFDVKFTSPTNNESIEIYWYHRDEIEYSHLSNNEKLDEIIFLETQYVEEEGGIVDKIQKKDIINSKSGIIFDIEYSFFKESADDGQSITRLYEVHTEHGVWVIYLDSHANSECEINNYCENIFDTLKNSFTILDYDKEKDTPYLDKINEIKTQTKITNPYNVHNSEFYNVNTECELKHLYWKDPNQAFLMYNVINSNSDRIEREYFARGGQMVEYGDRAALSESHALQGEIIAEIIMEKYSINPILKDVVIKENDEGREHSLEAEMIQDGTHPCEEEFKLYSPEKISNEDESTVTMHFTDKPIYTLELGQWVKMEAEFHVDSSRQELKTQFENLMPITPVSKGVNFSADDIEWSKIEIVELTKTDVTLKHEQKIQDISKLYDSGTSFVSIDSNNSYTHHELFIPTNVKIGHILSENEFVGQWIVSGFEKRTYGGKSIDTIHVTGLPSQSAYSGMVDINADLFYDKKTGMLLEYDFDALITDYATDSLTMGLKMKAIDFHIPSASIVGRGGGGCLIATAAFGSEMAPQVQFLREIRDNTVMTTQSGTAFMAGFNQFYYSFSPQIADYERENPVFKEAVKITLTPLLTSLTLLNYVDIDSEQEMLGYGIGIILLNIGMYFVAPAVLILRIKHIF